MRTGIFKKTDEGSFAYRGRGKDDGKERYRKGIEGEMREDNREYEKVQGSFVYRGRGEVGEGKRRLRRGKVMRGRLIGMGRKVRGGRGIKKGKKKVSKVGRGGVT